VLHCWRSLARQGPTPRRPFKNPRNAQGKTRGAYSDAERVAAVAAYRRSGLPQRVFAKTWGLSIKTLGNWLSRVAHEGESGLKGKKRGRPKGSRNKSGLPPAVSTAIVETKRRFPDFGLRKVAQHLVRFAGLKVSPTTVRTTLRRQGVALTPPARRVRRARPLPRRFERATPNQLWQSDITSLVLPRPGSRVYLTVFLDDHSRYVVSWALSSAQRGELVIEALRDGVARFGKPVEVLTDQGRQYFAWRGKSDFQRELKKLGIAHVVSRSHHPETLGKCERLWETVQAELWSRCSPLDIGEARERLLHFFAHYNHFRPHQGIGGSVPADRFFGAESEVRAAIERNHADNELHLALGEAPRKPVFLVGQIGEQAVSVHGERGRLVVVTPQGRQELNLEELGAAMACPQEVADGNNGAREADAAQPEAALPGLPAAGLAGAGAVGGGECGGESASAQGVRRDPGVVGGAKEPGERGDGAGCEAAACVAIESIGTQWDAGGPAAATEATGEGGDEGGLGRHEAGSRGAQEGERRAEAASGGGGAPDRAAAGPAGEQSESGAAPSEREGATGGPAPSGGKKEGGASGCDSP
jgi:transposase InsO family protein